MAGSYKHIINIDGSFCGIDLIDNLGDAHEALEECYEMIQYLTQGDRRRIFRAWREGYFKKHCPQKNLQLATYDYFWKD